MATMIPLSKIAAALGLLEENSSHHIAFVGGGGKTTLLHAIGRELKGKTILTTTTKMGSDQH